VCEYDDPKLPARWRLGVDWLAAPGDYAPRDRVYALDELEDSDPDPDITPS
jgi:hypothetical protein